MAFLTKEGVIVRTNYNAVKTDRVLWYRIDYQQLEQYLATHPVPVEDESEQDDATEVDVPTVWNPDLQGLDSRPSTAGIQLSRKSGIQTLGSETPETTIPQQGSGKTTIGDDEKSPPYRKKRKNNISSVITKPQHVNSPVPLNSPLVGLIFRNMLSEWGESASPALRDRVLEDLETVGDFATSEVIDDLFRYVALRGRERHNWGYARAVLLAWHKEGKVSTERPKEEVASVRRGSKGVNPDGSINL